MKPIYRIMLYGLLMIVAGCNYGCAYNSQTINADNGSYVVNCGEVNKPVDVSTALKGNVPLQGGSVDDAGANTAE